MFIKVCRVSENAILPVYATEGAGCFDLHAAEPGELFNNNTLTIRTGLCFEIPKGHVMLIFSRSGHGFKNDVRLANCVGVIDSDYRGEVMVKLTRDAPMSFVVHTGDRIAQAMIIPFEQCSFGFEEELSTTERGRGGFGSTGRNFIGMPK